MSARFSRTVIIQKTVRSLQRVVDANIDKTFLRIREFSEDDAKSKEVFDTLSRLHAMRKAIAGFNRQFNWEKTNDEHSSTNKREVTEGSSREASLEESSVHG